MCVFKRRTELPEWIIALIVTVVLLAYLFVQLSGLTSSLFDLVSFFVERKHKH